MKNKNMNLLFGWNGTVENKTTGGFKSYSSLKYISIANIPPLYEYIICCIID